MQNKIILAQEYYKKIQYKMNGIEHTGIRNPGNYFELTTFSREQLPEFIKTVKNMADQRGNINFALNKYLSHDIVQKLDGSGIALDMPPESIVDMRKIVHIINNYLPFGRTLFSCGGHFRSIPDNESKVQFFSPYFTIKFRKHPKLNNFLNELSDLAWNTTFANIVIDPEKRSLRVTIEVPYRSGLMYDDNKKKYLIDTKLALYIQEESRGFFDKVVELINIYGKEIPKKLEINTSNLRKKWNRFWLG